MVITQLTINPKITLSQLLHSKPPLANKIAKNNVKTHG